MEEVKKQQVLYARFAGFIISSAFNNTFYRQFNADFYKKKKKKRSKVFLLRKLDIELFRIY